MPDPQFSEAVVRSLEFPKVAIFIDDSHRLMHIVAEQTTNGRHLARAFRGLMQAQPEASAYDSIWHLLDFDGDATNDDVLEMQREYLKVAAPDARLAYTCLVTSDSCMTLWAVAMDEQFPGRRHLVMRSVEQAESWLNRTRCRCPEPAHA